MNESVLGYFLTEKFAADLRHYRKHTMWGAGRNRVGGLVGVSGQTIKRIEEGQEPSVSVFLCLCQLMGQLPDRYYNAEKPTQKAMF